MRHGVFVGLTVALMAVLGPFGLFRFSDERPKPDDQEEVGHPAGIIFRSASRGEKPLGALTKAREHRNAMLRHQAERAAARGGAEFLGITPNSWTSLGPRGVGGRVRAIVTHPEFTDFMLAGAATGGLWRTWDGGNFWAPSDDFMPSLTIGCMAQDPLDPLIVYAGTGEGFWLSESGTSNTSAIQGEGIFKSINFGAAWFQLASTANNPSFRFVNRIAVSPTTGPGNIVLAATSTGIHRSLDSGTSWTRVWPAMAINPDIDMYDVKFHPSDSLLAVAAQANGTLLYSSDGGATWSTAVPGTPAAQRAELAWAPSVSGKVYALSQIGDHMYVWASGDFGASYAQVTIQHAVDLDAFGPYAKTLWVDPTDDSRLLIGGVNLYASTDSGVNFTQVPDHHFDYHFLIEHPDYGSAGNTTVFAGCDGGVYRFDDPFAAAATWTDLNDRLVITQFYGADIHPSGVVVGGTQDNGTWALDPDTQQWTKISGADGAFVAIEPLNPSIMYYQTQSMDVYRTDDFGVSEIDLFDASDMGEGDPNFIAPLVLNPSANRLYIGGHSLWVTANPTSNQPNWSVLKAPIVTPPDCPPPLSRGQEPPPGHLFDNSKCAISTIAFSPQDINRIWVGYNNGEVWNTTNGHDNSPTWQRWDDLAALPDRWCADIVVDPNDVDSAYVSFMGYTANNVWKTADFGLTWINISGAGTTALPALPVNALAVHPTQPGWLYAGTDLGIYTSTDDGSTWSASNVGPSNVSVDELVFKNDKTLMAATHGRGIWTVDTFDDCNGNMLPDFEDIGSGFSADLDFDGIPDECESGPPPGTFDPTTGQMKMGKEPGRIVIHCAQSCSSGATAYGVYEGVLGSWYSHKAVGGVCQSTCPGQIRLTPAAGVDTYYLVVPNNSVSEGSYGTDRDTARVETERPRATPVTQRCAEYQMITSCP